MTTTHMAKVYSGEERRQYPRQSLPADTLVFIHKEPGTVIDMSKGGLAVHFVSLQPETPQPQLIDVFHGPSQFYLPQLPVRMVEEIALLPYPLFSSLSRRRLCMEFGQLTEAQHSQLVDFLHRNDSQSPPATTGGPIQERLL